MLTFQSITDLDQPLSDELRTIITDRLTDAASIGLADQTHITVVQAGDTEHDIEQELGWSPMVNPLSGERFGSRDFTPYWAWLQDLGGWYELLHPVGNSGFAYILLIEKQQGEFSSMCEQASCD